MSPPDDSCPAWLRLTMWLTYSLSWGLLILFDVLMDRCLRMSSANTPTTGTCYLLPWLQVGTSCSFKNQSSGSVIVFKHLPEHLCSLISDQIIDYQMPPPPRCSPAVGSCCSGRLRCCEWNRSSVTGCSSWSCSLSPKLKQRVDAHMSTG